MATGQVLALVVLGVGVAAALCWAIVGAAVHRARRARAGAGRAPGSGRR